MNGFAVPFPNNGDFEQDAAGNWQAYVPREYYRDCAATRTHLYALFSGRLSSKYPPGEAGQGAYLQIFTWDGKLERVLRLGRAANAFAMTDDTTLYTTTLATDTIYRYLLPRN
jgi:hypothetical protein